MLTLLPDSSIDNIDIENSLRYRWCYKGWNRYTCLGTTEPFSTSTTRGTIYAGSCWTSILIRCGCVVLWCLVKLVDRKSLSGCLGKPLVRIKIFYRLWPPVRVHPSGKDFSCLNRATRSCAKAISLSPKKSPICLFDPFTINHLSINAIYHNFMKNRLKYKFLSKRSILLNVLFYFLWR